MKRAVAIPVIAAGSFGLHATRALAQPAGGTPYKIGGTFPLTGPLATVTAEFIPGAELAVADVNKRGGVHGHPIQFAIEDTQGSPQGGLAALRKLAQVDGVQCAITVFTNVATAQIPLADQLKIPIIGPVEAPGIMSAGQYSFAHASTFPDVAPLLRDYWRGMKAKRIYAILGNNAYGRGVAPVMRDAVASVGAEYAEAFVDLSATDFRGVATQAREFNADQILVGLQGSTTETAIIKQLRELGVTAQLINPADFYQSKPWREAAGPYAEGMIFAGLYVNPAISRDFILGYRNKVGADPSYGAAEVYDMVRMLAYAIGKGGYNGEAIRTVLVSLRGVPSVFGGQIEMKDNHYTKISAVGLFKVRAGKLQKIG